MPPPPPTRLSAPLIPSLHFSDSNIYPSPLTLAQLTRWIFTVGQYSSQYVGASGKLCGVVVALPLKRTYWERVVAGEIKEWEISQGMFMLDAVDEREGGLHVWHVERYPAWEKDWGRFGEVVKRDLGLGVRRWSALCVSETGVKMFERLGGSEGEYQGQVVVGGKIVERAEWDGVGVEEGWARMLVGGPPNAEAGDDGHV